MARIVCRFIYACEYDGNKAQHHHGCEHPVRLSHLQSLLFYQYSRVLLLGTKCPFWCPIVEFRECRLGFHFQLLATSLNRPLILFLFRLDFGDFDIAHEEVAQDDISNRRGHIVEGLLLEPQQCQRSRKHRCQRNRVHHVAKRARYLLHQLRHTYMQHHVGCRKGDAEQCPPRGRSTSLTLFLGKPAPRRHPIASVNRRLVPVQALIRPERLGAFIAVCRLNHDLLLSHQIPVSERLAPHLHDHGSDCPVRAHLSEQPLRRPHPVPLPQLPQNPHGDEHRIQGIVWREEVIFAVKGLPIDENGAGGGFTNHLVHDDHCGMCPRFASALLDDVHCASTLIHEERAALRAEAGHFLSQGIESWFRVLIQIGHVLRDDTGPAAVRAPDAIDRVGRGLVGGVHARHVPAALEARGLVADLDVLGPLVLAPFTGKNLIQIHQRPSHGRVCCYHCSIQ